MKDLLIGIILFIVLLWMPIYSFGHCLNNSHVSFPEKGLGCILTSTITYPFYWSWELQRAEAATLTVSANMKFEKYIALDKNDKCYISTGEPCEFEDK